jgi:type III pantothenate kinase
MILTLDVGNSNICIGTYRDGEAVFTARIRTDALKTETEYAVLLDEILAIHHVKPEELEGAALSCVVPSLTPILRDAIRSLADVSVLTVGPGVKTGINIRVDEPTSCGADLVCTAVGAVEKYPLPAIIVDLGTATKITIVDKNRNYIGGMIAPGVEVSLGALSASAALLPNISIARSIKAIGTNTVDAMAAGSILGTASMIDGMIDRYLEAFGEVETIVACGGLAKAVIPHCRRPIVIDSDLLLDGLLAVYKKNR